MTSEPTRESTDVQVARAIGAEVRQQPDIYWLDYPPLPAYSTDRDMALCALERWQKIGPSRRGEIIMNYGGHWTVCLSDKESRRTSTGGPSESLSAAICAAILAGVVVENR